MARRRFSRRLDRRRVRSRVLVEQVSERLAEFGFTDQRDLDLIREDVRFTLRRNWRPSLRRLRR